MFLIDLQQMLRDECHEWELYSQPLFDNMYTPNKWGCYPRDILTPDSLMWTGLLYSRVEEKNYLFLGIIESHPSGKQPTNRLLFFFFF